MTDLESQIQLNRARVLIERGEKQAAYDLLQKVMKINQRIPEAWYIASLLTEKESRRIEMLQNALKLRPDYPEAKQRLEGILHPLDVPVTADLNDFTQPSQSFAEATQRTAIVSDETPRHIDVVTEEDEYESSIPRRPSTRITDTSEFMGDPLLQVAAYRYEEELAELERYQHDEEDSVVAQLDEILNNNTYNQPDTSYIELERLAQGDDYPDEDDAHAELDKILSSAAYNQIEEDDQESVDFPVIIPRATAESKVVPAPRSTAELKAVKRNTGKLQEPNPNKRRKGQSQQSTTGKGNGKPPEQPIATRQITEPTPINHNTGQLQDPTAQQITEPTPIKRNTGQLQDPTAQPITEPTPIKRNTGQLQDPTAQPITEPTPIKRNTGQLEQPLGNNDFQEQAGTTQRIPRDGYSPTFVETYENDAHPEFAADEDYITDEIVVAESHAVMDAVPASESQVVVTTQRPPFPLPWTSTWSQIQASWLQGAGETGTQIGKFLQAQIVNPLKLAIVVVWVVWMVWSPYTIIFYTVFLLALAYSPERPYVLETLDRWISGVANYLKRVWAWLRYKG